jgi:hypothetical protein
MWLLFGANLNEEPCVKPTRRSASATLDVNRLSEALTGSAAVTGISAELYGDQAPCSRRSHTLRWHVPNTFLRKQEVPKGQQTQRHGESLRSLLGPQRFVRFAISLVTKPLGCARRTRR